MMTFEFTEFHLLSDTVQCTVDVTVTASLQLFYCFMRCSCIASSGVQIECINIVQPTT